MQGESSVIQIFGNWARRLAYAQLRLDQADRALGGRVLSCPDI